MTDLRANEEIVLYNEQLKKGPCVLLINALLTVEEFEGSAGKYLGMREISMAIIVATVAKDTKRKK